MIRDALANALEALRDIDAISATYERGAYSATVNAVIGRGRRSSREQDNATLEAEELDFLIAREDLILNSAATLPATGDTITAEINGETRTYTVVPRDAAAPYAWSDPATQTQLRIFAKLTN